MHIETTSREALAKLCIKEKMFVPKKALKPMLKLLTVCPNLGRIGVCFVDDEAVGVIVITKWYRPEPSKIPWVMVFVKPQFRRMGIGTALLEHMIKKFRYRRENLEFSKGNRGSVKFFVGLGITRNDFY